MHTSMPSRAIAVLPRLGLAFVAVVGGDLVPLAGEVAKIALPMPPVPPVTNAVR